jgi:hypothetical protein
MSVVLAAVFAGAGLISQPVLISAAIANPFPRATQLCFDRPGETGILNILPVSIRVGSPMSPENSAVLTLLGEKEVCLKTMYVESPTRVAVTFRFPRPYWYSKNPETWTTKPVWITVKPGDTINVLLCRRNAAPNSDKKTAWHNIWVLSPPESRRACTNF